MSVLGGKLLIAAGCAALGFLLSRLPIVRRLDRATFDRLGVIALLGSRLALFTMVFLVAGQEPQSDVPDAYFPQGLAALKGAVPYRDFGTVYSPLFPYIMAGPVALWHSSKSIVLLAIFIEVANYLVWLAVARKTTDESTARMAALLYVCSPLALINVALDGQNQVLLSALIGASVLALYCGRKLLSGFFFALAFAGVKLLAILFAPVLALDPRGRRRWGVAAVVPAALVFGAVSLLGGDVLMPARIEGQLVTAGNLPFLLGSLLGRWVPAVRAHVVQGFILFSATAWIAWLHYKRRLRDSDTPALIAAVLLLFMFLSPKSYTNYLEIFLAPLAIAVAPLLARPLACAGFVCFQAVAVLEPSLWFRWLGQKNIPAAFAAARTPMAVAEVAVFLLVDLFLVASYLVLIIALGRRLSRRQENACHNGPTGLSSQPQCMFSPASFSPHEDRLP